MNHGSGNYLNWYIIPFNIESEIKTRLSGAKDYEPFIQIKKRKC